MKNNKANSIFKLISLLLVVLLPYIVNAKKYKLNYQPHGIIVKFQFDSIIIYTDTTSLLSIYNEKDSYDLRVMKYIRKSIKDINNDTITFIGKNILFNDGINKYPNDWYIEWALLQLIKNKKVQLINRHGQKVRIISTKKIGRKKTNYIKRSYIDKETNEELFKETLFARIINPSF